MTSPPQAWREDRVLEGGYTRADDMGLARPPAEEEHVTPGQ